MSHQSINGALALNIFSKLDIKKLSSALQYEDPAYIKIGIDQEDLYKSPSGYIPWNTHLRAAFMSGTAAVMIKGYESSDILAAKVGVLARDAVALRAPARYITKELCEAFMETPIPVLSKDVLNILPYIHIFLPRGCVHDHMGDEVVSLIVHSGCLYPRDLPDESSGRRLMEKVFPKEIMIPPELAGSSGIQVATITPEGSNFWQEFIDDTARSWQHENVKQREKSGYSYIETEKIIRIAINSLLVHLYEPELITTDPARAVSGTGFGLRRPEKSPLGATWIGKTFRYQRAKKEAPSGLDGDRASVRAHWRRGHWHTVLHGKNKQERRVQWFKPVFVSGITP